MGLGGDWDAFRETMRSSDDVFDVETLTVYNYTGGYDPTKGKTNWTRDSGTEIRGQVEIDQPDVVSAADGLQSADGDADLLVRDDAESHWDVTFHPVGTEDQKPTEIAYGSRLFLVSDVVAQHNGLDLVVLVEADR